MEAFYKDFSSIKNDRYDGLIITGAPVENLDFEEVTYWDELCEIMDWSRGHVFSTLHICWAAQAGLKYHYGVPKYALPKKMFGIYSHYVTSPRHPIVRGFDEYFRDKAKGLDIDVPYNYFPGDDPEKRPPNVWRGHANLLFSNWLNYFVYQNTPYDLGELS